VRPLLESAAAGSRPEPGSPCPRMRRAGIRRLPGSYECFEQIVCSFKRGRRTRLAATRTLIVNSPRLGEQLITTSVVVTPS